MSFDFIVFTLIKRMLQSKLKWLNKHKHLTHFLLFPLGIIWAVDDCMEHKKEDYQNCSVPVLYTQL